MVGLFVIAIALQLKHQRVTPRRLTVVIDRLNAAFYVGPELFLQRLSRHAKSLRVLDAERRTIGVIVEKVDVRAPTQPHLEP